MKPRERKSQKQTSKIMLRKQLHRDVVFDKKFHNAMFVYKETKRDEKGKIIEEGIFNYVWMKYAKNALLQPSRILRCPIGWWDVDRQIHYGLNAGEGSSQTGQEIYFHNRPYYSSDFLLKRNLDYWKLGEDEEAFAISLHWDGVNPVYKRLGLWTKDGITWTSFRYRISVNGTYHEWGDEWTPPDGWMLDGMFDHKCGKSGCCCMRTSQGSVFWRRIYLYAFSIEDESIFNEWFSYVVLTAPGEQEYWVEDTKDSEGRLIRRVQHRISFSILDNTNTGVRVRKDIRTYTSNINPDTGKITNSSALMEQDMHFTWNGEQIYYPVTIISPDELGYEAYSYNRKIYLDSYSNGEQSVTAYLHTKVYKQDGIGGDPDTYEAWSYIMLDVIDSDSTGGQSYVPLGEHMHSTGTSPGPAPTTAKAKILYRNGNWYVFVATDFLWTEPEQGESEIEDKWYPRQTVLFSSTGKYIETISEHKLPTWWDLPYATKSGAFTNRTPNYEKLRVAINPSFTTDADVDLYDLNWNDGVMFRDGKINEQNDITYFTFWNEVFGVYIDFKFQSKSFAWQWATESSTNMNEIMDIADEVIEYDYCYPAGGFEGETTDPDLHYLYYVWLEDELKFQVVDRHLSTYAGYTIIYVEILPPTGLPQILYGVKTDLNENPIYDYYIWIVEDEDLDIGHFELITDLSVYDTRYTVVKENRLPNSGRPYIIYAIPRDTDSYDTNMYIWNPDAIRYEEDTPGHYIEVHGDYEEIDTTEYDMLYKTFKVYNVKSLPNIGHEGIIYISEQKYTPKRKVYEDRDYNYYVWLPAGYFKRSTPVVNRNRWHVITVERLPESGEGSEPGTVWRILKSLDPYEQNSLYPSEEFLKDYLRSRTLSEVQWLNDKKDLPFIGEPYIYYIVKETPGEFTGFYTIYLWNASTKKYEASNSYEYFIKDDPQHPELRNRIIYPYILD